MYGSKLYTWHLQKDSIQLLKYLNSFLVSPGARGHQETYSISKSPRAYPGAKKCETFFRPGTPGVIFKNSLCFPGGPGRPGRSRADRAALALKSMTPEPYNNSNFFFNK